MMAIALPDRLLDHDNVVAVPCLLGRRGLKRRLAGVNLLAAPSCFRRCGFGLPGQGGVKRKLDGLGIGRRELVFKWK